jgi:cystathionine gamma-synthase
VTRPVQIRPYREGDLSAVAAALLDVRNDRGTYLPPYVEASLTGVSEWLQRYPALRRWVAVDGGVVVGHVQVVASADTDPDLPRFLDDHTDVRPDDCLEVARLFVAPSSRRAGVGRALLDAATDFIVASGYRPALCVLTTQSEAAALYRESGWVERGSFVGVSGVENLVFTAAGSGPTTRLVHAGVRPGPEQAVATGIAVSTTFATDTPGSFGEFAYARSQNPTRKALEEALAVAEGAGYASAFSSGLAAIDSVCRMVPPGGVVLVGADSYGGTWRLLNQVWANHRVGVRVADTTDLDAVAAALAPGDVTLAVVETPSNPGLSVTDIAAVADLAHRHGALLVVDNTFATPWLQRPLALGADVVVHSATKYLGGHSDVVAGALATNDADLAERFAFTQRAVGAVPGPFDSFLVLRGLRTLGLRMRRHCENASSVAAFLDRHPAVGRVLYPGLPSHPNHEVAARQMRYFGGMVSFTCRDVEAAAAVARRTRLFTLAESLGAVESLIEVPAVMTHAANAGSQLEVDPSLVRLSVGVEDADDLVADLDAALRG